MNPEDRLDEAGKQVAIVLEQEDLSEEMQSYLRTARYRIGLIQGQLEVGPDTPTTQGSN